MKRRIEAHEVKAGDLVTTRFGHAWRIVEILDDGNLFMERVTGRAEWTYTPHGFNRMEFRRIKG